MLAARTLLLAGLVSCLAALSLQGDESTQTADEATLRSAGFTTDGPGLLDFFRKRTLSPEEQAKLADTIRKLGDNAFGVREKATRDLISAGRSAIPFLRPALTDPDLEISRRAERCLQTIEGGAGMAQAMAASRLLAIHKPEGAVEVVLNFLPFADDDSVEDELRTTLSVVGIKDGKADGLLIKALKDPVTVRRAAAALVVGRSPQAEQRQLVKALLSDPEAAVRLRAAQGIIAGKEKDAVPALVALLADAPMHLAWQAEELLSRIAGEQTPQISLGAGDPADRQKCREAWTTWWRDQEPKIDLAKLDMEKRSLGLTLIVVYDGYTNGQGRVWEFGLDRKQKWNIDTNIQGPIDAQMLSASRLLLAEYNARRVTERDTSGKILWEHRVNGNPVACQRLPNGNTFIATLNQVLEVTAGGKELYTHNIPNGSVTFAQKQRNGRILHISTNGTLVEMDDKGAVLKSIKVGGNGSEWLSFEVLPGGRFLVPQQNASKLIEYDSSGKAVWEVTAPRPYSASRLPNGNTICCSMNDSKMFEVDRAGKVVWEEKLQGRPFRIARR